MDIPRNEQIRIYIHIYVYIIYIFFFVCRIWICVCSYLHGRVIFFLFPPWGNEEFKCKCLDILWFREDYRCDSYCYLSRMGIFALGNSYFYAVEMILQYSELVYRNVVTVRCVDCGVTVVTRSF